ncbi:hypothetical protein [Candidatus Villigracilis saccharophilus]|uniref:hypothetical protein n=1 Tax=Candidatus Villigracilis saccharophilus TaxID=3140684 RepID=UPI0031361A96|nr:hypothetical protein [Anaerolineales bacterium]
MSLAVVDHNDNSFGTGPGTFSLVTFYARRARKIMPALFTVLLASFLRLAFGCGPRGQAGFSSLIAVFIFLQTFYSANIWLLDTANELRPLLHIGLAVEEQFYILFRIFWY